MKRTLIGLYTVEGQFPANMSLDHVNKVLERELSLQLRQEGGVPALKASLLPGSAISVREVPSPYFLDMLKQHAMYPPAAEGTPLGDELDTVFEETAHARVVVQAGELHQLGYLSTRGFGAVLGIDVPTAEEVTQTNEMNKENSDEPTL
jgi:hypothetical protein